jgi:hypothetical protein
MSSKALQLRKEETPSTVTLPHSCISKNNAIHKRWRVHDEDGFRHWVEF